MLDYLNPFSDNFLLKGVISGISSILDYINPFSENFILKDVINFLGNLVSYVNPFSENFLGKKLVELFSNMLKELFIPTGNPFEEIMNKFNNKFSFVGQIEELANSLLNVPSTLSDSEVDIYANFKVTYEGYTFSIFDLSLLEPYRGALHTLIIAISYITFAFRLYKRLPGIIQGFSIY